MRALSIRMPYALQILSAAKTEEYRSRRTKIRERILICAASTSDDPSLQIPTGIMVCTVQIVSSKYLGGDQYAWKLAEPRAVVPRKLKGKLGFFPVDDSLIVPFTLPFADWLSAACAVCGIPVPLLPSEYRQAERVPEEAPTPEVSTRRVRPYDPHNTFSWEIRAARNRALRARR